MDGKRKRHGSSPATTPSSQITSSISNRRISEESRPRREIHPPPSKDYPETWTKKPNPKTNTAELKFCGQAIRELKKGKHKAYSYPFLVPVDYVALNIPDYPTIVKQPMDLSTIEHKWAQGDYATAVQFEKDIRLMFNNCYAYNPPALPVHQMARNLEKVFDEKWQHKPSATPTPPPLSTTSSIDRLFSPSSSPPVASAKKTKRRKTSPHYESMEGM
jgi:bromodomain-containing factor 1